MAMDGQLESNLERMRAAVADLLLKLSNKFTNRKRRVVFLINNYDCVCSVLREAKPVVVDDAGASPRTGSSAGAGRGGASVGAGGAGASGAGTGAGGGGGLSLDNSATYRFFDEQLTAASHVFVEEELADHFGPLIDFVRKAESAQKSAAEGGGGAAAAGAAGAAGASGAGGAGGADGTGGGLYTPEAASVLMRDFAERWKGAIEQMHRDVISDHFSNLQRGMDILQRTLSQLLIYYTRLTGPEGVLARMGPQGAALCKDAVSNPSFIYEIKRHSTSRVL